VLDRQARVDALHRQVTITNAGKSTCQAACALGSQQSWQQPSRLQAQADTRSAQP